MTGSRASRGAVVLAGGLSTRMGQPKEWLLLDGEPLLTRITHVLASCCDHVVVVARAEQSLPPLASGVARIDDPLVEGESARSHEPRIAPISRVSLISRSPQSSSSRVSQGPLPALIEGLAWLETRGVELAYLSSCDAACLTHEHVEFMLVRLETKRAASAFPLSRQDSPPSAGEREGWGDESPDKVNAILPVSSDRHEHPLASVVRTDIAARVGRQLVRRGERRLRALFAAHELATERVDESQLPDRDVLRSFNTEREWASLPRATRR